MPRPTIEHERIARRLLRLGAKPPACRFCSSKFAMTGLHEQQRAEFTCTGCGNIQFFAVSKRPTDEV